MKGTSPLIQSSQKYRDCGMMHKTSGRPLSKKPHRCKSLLSGMRFPYFSPKITPSSDKNDVAPRRTGGSDRREIEQRKSRYVGHLSYPIRGRFVADPKIEKKQRGTPLSKSLQKVNVRRDPRNLNESTTVIFWIVLELFSRARNSENFSVPLTARPGPVLRQTSTSPTRHDKHLPMPSR